MNLLERYAEHLRAEKFNNTEHKGYLTVNGYGFDIRIVNNKVLCNGLDADHFLDECQFDTVEERHEFLTAINNWKNEIER